MVGRPVKTQCQIFVRDDRCIAAQRFTELKGSLLPPPPKDDIYKLPSSRHFWPPVKLAYNLLNVNRKQQS